ncbi:MAG: hypothetical protein PHD90_08190 [Bacteroidales bacterium]|nr:hypothetical protein [Bacteroidales bacterium]
MSDEIGKINELIKDYFSENLVSLAVFGSTCTKTNFSITSDIDYIIILEQLNKTQDKISRDLKNKLRYSFPLVAFNIYSRKEFNNILVNNPWLVLTIKLGYIIYFDDNKYFENIIENSFKQLKHKKIARLAWHIDSQDSHKTVLDHYFKLSKQYYKSAQILYDNNLINIALEQLLDSIHSYMINKLLIKNIFVTTGEICQLFFKVYSNDSIYSFKDSFLFLEQIMNQKHSFDFDKNGEMLFLLNESPENKLIFNKVIKNFKKLQIFFNNHI